MKEIKRFQVRGIPGAVTRADFSGRIVDFWAPAGGSDHVLIAHDGQNIFDRKTATFIYTWRLAQTAIRVARECGKRPPLIIGVFHSSSKSDPHGRAKDLCPEDPFREGVQPASAPLLSVNELHGNSYLENIFNKIAPEIASRTHSTYLPANTAMIGSSMGGLATLYAAIKHSDKFRASLALSTHWPLAENALVDWMVPKLPQDNGFKVWMSRGTKGLDALYKPFQDRADQLMNDLHWNASHFKSKVFHRTSHNERSWASYVDEPLRFWLS
ncbi:MAG: alpha/beta hydrolase-fold protein [Actinomycetota bacterium]